MAAALIMLAFIALFVGTIVLVQFPPIATEIYSVISAVLEYISSAMGIVWFIFPKHLTLVVVGLTIAIEIIIRNFGFFIWIYNRLKQ